MLGLTHDELQFQCFSKNYGLEKPDPRFFRTALLAAESACSDTSTPLRPSEILHIGNDYSKDFEGARKSGMHGLLLNRYDEPGLAEEWQRRGAVVLTDLMDVVEFLGRSNCRLG
jgi:putative hydrolase of the HAD superfamily